MSETRRVAVEEENVLIQAGDCSIVIAPQFGGKIASLRAMGHELLQAPLAAMEPRTQTMPFEASDASGWDECLPSVAQCTVHTTDGPAQIPDHGDLWRVAWQPINIGVSGATLRGTCFSLPLVVDRMLKLETAGVSDNQSWRLSLHYKVTNTGESTIPWSWAAHPLFAIEPGDRIILPDSITRLRVEGSGGGRLGQSGDTISWPIAELASGGQADLSVAQPPNEAIGDKLFAGPLGARENWCTVERPSVGLRIRVHFDPAATPYLGLWICYGGWPDRPGSKQNCVALEPATAPVDSLAQTGPWSRTLPSGQSAIWTMGVDIELM
jgi:galactose mutarotase-like enzyme